MDRSLAEDIRIIILEERIFELKLEIKKLRDFVMNRDFLLRTSVLSDVVIGLETQLASLKEK